MHPNKHVSKEQIEGLKNTSLGKAERREVVRHLLAGCEECIELARSVVMDGEELDYAGVMRRLGLSFVVAKQVVKEERQYAEDVWEDMLGRLDSGQRLRAIRDNPRFHTWGLLDLILTTVRKLVREDAFAASDLAHTALYLADLLPEKEYGAERIADCKAAAYATLGNTKRVIGDFDGAREAIASGFAVLENGTGDPYEEAQLISIMSSLETDLGNFEEATEMLGDAVLLAREVGDRLLEGRYRIQQSSAIGWFDPQSGVELAHYGLKLIMGSGKRDDYLELAGRHLTALWNHELGFVSEARGILETYRYLYSLFPEISTTGRLLHLEALISRSEGRIFEAERFFRQLVDLYVEGGLEFDLALSSLDWSETLVMLGRYDDAGEAMGRVFPLIQRWNIHSDVLRSWTLVQDAIRGKVLQDANFRELSLTLRRKWNWRKSQA